jgi:hypothetical protein
MIGVSPAPAEGRPGCVDPDGTLGMKWPWWRGARGPFVIEGRRLDGPAAP